MFNKIISNNTILDYKDGYKSYSKSSSKLVQSFVRTTALMGGSAIGSAVGGHDDLLMTRAIGLHICYKEMEPPTIITISDRYEGSLVKRPVSAATIA